MENPDYRIRARSHDIDANHPVLPCRVFGTESSANPVEHRQEFILALTSHGMRGSTMSWRLLKSTLGNVLVKLDKHRLALRIRNIGSLNMFELPRIEPPCHLMAGSACD